MGDMVVTRLAVEDGRRLYEALGRESFAFRPLDHAWWSARGGDVVATWYRSGKLVVQGRGAETFRARFLPAVLAPSAPVLPDGIGRLRGPTIGSDESGKGDYFGPLVVAAALVTPADLGVLDSLGVEDSKLATDARVRRAEGMLLERLPSEVLVLEPEAYNAAYARVGNLNALLGELHARAIDAVLARTPGTQARIVVDRFGDPEHVRRNLSSAARARPFTMPTQGERDPAVAAASFLARAAFLRHFEELKGLAGDELYLGASDRRITPLARRLREEGGLPWLGRFAKLHFKITKAL